MAKKSLVVKSQRKVVFSTRRVNRCQLCNRPRGFMRRFKLCRICFRNLASQSKVPGVTKSSW